MHNITVSNFRHLCSSIKMDKPILTLLYCQSYVPTNLIIVVLSLPYCFLIH